MLPWAFAAGVPATWVTRGATLCNDCDLRHWEIEEDFQRGKETGPDRYEARRWNGRNRHIMLCLLAHAFLAVTQATVAGKEGDAMPLPVAVPEARCLLALLVLDRLPIRVRLH